MDTMIKQIISATECRAIGTPSPFDGNDTAPTMTIFVLGKNSAQSQAFAKTRYITKTEALRLYDKRIELNSVQFESHV